MSSVRIFSGTRKRLRGAQLRRMAQLHLHRGAPPSVDFKGIREGDVKLTAY